MTNNPKLAMFAQVAINNGDAINAYRLMNEKLSVPDAVDVLSQSSNYKEILPAALEAYTRDGARIGAVIASFPEFDHRRTVAKELTHLVENHKHYPIEAVSNLENPYVQEQLIAVEEGFPQRYKYNVNPVARLAIVNAMYGQHQTTDRLLDERFGEEIIPALQLIVKDFNEKVYGNLVDETFELYDELEDKGDIKVLHPGLQTNDVELTKALRSFANKYQKTTKEYGSDWCWSMPKFERSLERYSWEGNTFIDTVKRIEALFETKRASLVGKVFNRINRNEHTEFGREQIYETPEDVLSAAERIKDANLPEEVYIALGTEFEGTVLSRFANNISQESVLKKLIKLDKMGPHLGKAAIGYTACYGTPEDVQYVAENILKVTRLGKAKQIFKAVMSDGRWYSGKGAERLRAFLPEGIKIRKLSDAGKKIIRAIGFRGDLEHITTIHEVLKENQDRLKGMIELPKGYYFPITFSSDSPEEVKQKYEEWLGVESPKSKYKKILFKKFD